eukprot:12603783-Ditylum_brightwellii.AAC.1
MRGQTSSPHWSTSQDQHRQTCAQLGFWHQRNWEHLPSNRKGPHAFRGGRQGTGGPGVLVPAGKHSKLQA